jgi:folate-dependent phosphoribosylglycinamide formyltransferase PurN
MRIGLLGTLKAPLMGYMIRELLAHGIDIHGIILDSAPQLDRDRRLYEERTGGRLPPLPLECFEEAAIPYYFVTDHRNVRAAVLVKSLGFDLLLNAGTPRILDSLILNAPKIGILNCHPGLLPEFRGCTCVEWAIFWDKQIGNTVHFMTGGIDEGPIVLQEGLSFNHSDLYVDVRVKVYEHAFGLMARAVRRVIEDGLTPEMIGPQEDGHYYGVIGAEEMKSVIRKLEEGRYAFQIRER